MPGWAKALIIIAVLAVLLVVGVIVAGAYWWSHNKDALIRRGKAQITEGHDFGLTTDNQGCVDYSILRYKADRGFAGAIAANLFLQSCLDSSKQTPAFCDEVPRETEFIKSSEWRLTQCKRVDLSADQYCQQLFAPVQRFCEMPKALPEPSISDEKGR